VAQNLVRNAGRRIDQLVCVEELFRQRIESIQGDQWEGRRKVDGEIPCPVTGNIPLVGRRNIQTGATTICGVRFEGRNRDAFGSRGAVVLGAIPRWCKLKNRVVAIRANTPDVIGRTRRTGKETNDQ